MPANRRREPLSPALGPIATRVGLAALVLVLVLVFGACSSDPLDEARALQAQNRFEASLEPLHELMSVDEPAPEVLYRYGLALTRVGKPSEALWSLRRAMEDPDWLLYAGHLLASNAIEGGNQDSALEVLEVVLDANPDDVQALLFRGYARLETRRDYEGALADALRVLEREPDNTGAKVIRIVALLGLEREEEAGPLIHELEMADLAPELGGQGDGLTAIWCTSRGSFAIEQGDAEKAREVYLECAERYPLNARVISETVALLDSQGDHERATEILRGAFERSEGARFRTELVIRLESMGEVEEALRLLREAVDADDPRVKGRAFADLGGFLMAQERVEEGIEAYADAVRPEREPSDQTLFAYAEALVRAGQLERALALAERMKVDAYVHFTQGRVHFAREQPEQALASFSQALRLWPNSAVGRYYAALAAEQLGDFERAEEEYRASLRADPEASDARLRLARLYRAEGEDLAALGALQHMLRDDSPQPLSQALLELELLGARGVPLEDFPQRLRRLSQTANRARALAAYAAGRRQQEGPLAAVEAVEDVTGLRITDPRDAPALRSVVTDLISLGRAPEALSLARRAVDAHPQSGALLEVLAVALEGTGAPRDQVETQLEKALSLAPDHGRVLLSVAQHREARGELDEALALLERATPEARTEAPDERRLTLARAHLLRELDRPGEAQPLLEQLLKDDPYDAAVALELASLVRSHAHGDASRVRKLAQQAARFGGGEPASRLLSELQ